ncbi:MAG: VWD domain-containing protein [Cyanobacteria bacterium P01_A01_bin.123]
MKLHPLKSLRSRWFRGFVLALLTFTFSLGMFTHPAPADAELDRLASEIKAGIESRTGYRFTKPVIATQDDAYQAVFLRSADHRAHTESVVRDPVDSSRWIALVDPIGRGGGPRISNQWDACLVTLGDGWTGLDAPSQRSMLAHEIYHCYQKERMGLANHLEMAFWVGEGSAEWAGEAYVGGSAESSSPGRIFSDESVWHAYLSRSRRLSDRIYDAMGVFAHLDEVSSGDNWRLLDRFFATGPYPNGATRDRDWFEKLLSITNRNEFLQTWAMGLERNSSLSDWNTTGPGITSDRRDAEALTIGTGKRMPAIAQWLYELDIPEGEIVSIEVTNGHGGIRWGRDTTRISGSFNRQYCVGDTCRCDDGSSPPGVESVSTNHAVIALTAYPDAGTLWPRFEDSPCEEEEEPADPGTDAPSGSATGSSHGDPHILTYDGYRYSFQTVGEFVLSKSTDGHFEVQARQSQVPDRPLSLNTAVAMKVGDHRVAMYAQNAPDGITPLWIDGVPTELRNDTLTLSGGGTVQHYGDRYYAVILPTGEQVAINGIQAGGADFWNIAPTVSRSQTGPLIGLLGDFNGNGQDDLRGRNGQVVPSQDAYAPVTQLINRVIDVPIPLNQVQNAFFEQLYRQFGDSWRIAQAESLFDYAPGQSTETFTNQAFPSQFPSLVGVAPDTIRNAVQLCQDAGVAEALMEGCVFDIAATGQPGFLQAALNAVGQVVVDEVSDRVEDEVRDRVEDAIPIPIPIPGLPF